MQIVEPPQFLFNSAAATADAHHNPHPGTALFPAIPEAFQNGFQNGTAHSTLYAGATTLTSCLELVNVEHIGEIAKGTLFQKLTGNIPSGPVLKDVSFEVYSGELMAILGSSGSGKRALLDVISRRALGTTRGIILLNQMPLTAQIFQEVCAIVTLRSDLIPGLSVQQTITFAAGLTVSRVLSANQRHERVKRVVDDMGLNDPQLLNKEVSLLTTSEKRRLIIAMELVRDPLVVLIDEPTRDLDPLNSYLVISCLANYAKKYDRILVITLEKPRSGIVALLDRVTILSLGDVVYTGYTKTMVDYFSRIGFPCPQLENPLMYYLCLATVDRRSKDRFTETNGHIEMLVQKYKFEGEPYKRYAPSTDENGRINPPVLSALAKPGSTSNLGTLVGRKFTHLFGFLHAPLSSISWETIFLRVLAFPCLCFFVWLFYYRLNNRSQYSFTTRNGLIFNALAMVSFLSAIQTTFSFSSFRTRYFQESRSGAYSGRVFILSEVVHSAFVNLITVFSGSAILFYGCGLRDRDDGLNFILFSFVLYCCWNFVELQTNCLMVCIKEPLEALSTTLFITIFYLVCASGTVKSIYNLDDWLFFLTYGTIYRYAGSVINYNEFFVASSSAQDLLGRNGVPCGYLVDSQTHCRYLNSTDYLLQRYTRPSNPTFLYMDMYRDFGLCWVFYVGMVLVALLVYSIPLPSFIKRKYRD